MSQFPNKRHSNLLIPERTLSKFQIRQKSKKDRKRPEKKGTSRDKNQRELRIKTKEGLRLQTSPSASSFSALKPSLLTSSFHQKSQNSLFLKNMESNRSKEDLKAMFNSPVKRPMWVPGLKTVPKPSVLRKTANSKVFRMTQNKKVKLKMAKELLWHFKIYEKQIQSDYTFKKARMNESELEDNIVKNERERYSNYLGVAASILAELHEVSLARPFSRSNFNRVILLALEKLLDMHGSFMGLLFFLYNLGKIFILLHETNKGILIFVQVKRICRIARLNELKMHVYKYLAIAHQEAKAYKSAILCLGKMLQLAWLGSNHHYESLAYDLLGMQFYYLEDIHRSQIFHDRMTQGWMEPNTSQIKIVSIQTMFNEQKNRPTQSNILTISDIIKSALMILNDKLLIGSMEDSSYEDIDDLVMNVASSFEVSKAPKVSGPILNVPKTKEGEQKIGNDPYKFTKKNDISPFAERAINQKLKLIKEKRDMDHNLRMNQLLMTRTRPKGSEELLKASFTEQGILEYLTRNFKNISGGYEEKIAKNTSNRVDIKLEKITPESDILLTHLSTCKQLINFMVNNENVNHIKENSQDKFEVQFGDEYNFFNPSDMLIISGIIKKLQVNFTYASEKLLTS